MFIALSFMGTLPKYIVESIHQIRCFYQDSVYLITNDLASSYLNDIVKYSVNVIDYNDVLSQEFNDIITKTYNRFCIIPGLVGREELFIRSFERFFVLQNLMKIKDLTDCLYLEVDNLIYDDPYKWLPEFQKYEMCYMFDHYQRCSGGLSYIRTADSLTGFLKLSLDYIQTSNDMYLNEMTCLFVYYESVQAENKVQILPSYWTEFTVPQIATENFHVYNSLFDPLGIGCNLLGLDPFHTGGNIVKGSHNPWGLINYTKNQFEWKTDEEGRRRPYILYGDQWILVNNLHVHSKDLLGGLSRPLEEILVKECNNESEQEPLQETLGQECKKDIKVIIGILAIGVRHIHYTKNLLNKIIQEINDKSQIQILVLTDEPSQFEPNEHVTHILYDKSRFSYHDKLIIFKEGFKLADTVLLLDADQAVRPVHFLNTITQLADIEPGLYPAFCWRHPADCSVENFLEGRVGRVPYGQEYRQFCEESGIILENMVHIQESFLLIKKTENIQTFIDCWELLAEFCNEKDRERNQHILGYGEGYSIGIAAANAGINIMLDDPLVHKMIHSFQHFAWEPEYTE